MTTRCALLVGSGSYVDTTFAGLEAPAADLEGLAAVLRSPAICHFDDVKVVRDLQAYELRIALSEFFSRASADDLLVFYFTGHGVRNESGELFLCARDTRRHLLRATALAASDISKDMDLCRSSQQVLILDCCHAGAFAKGAKSSGQGASVGTEEAFRGNGRGRVVLTSSDATQLAFEGERIIGQPVRSVFTHYLIEGLQRGKADINGDGRITVDELYLYAYEQMMRAGHAQTPGKWVFRQQGDIVLARNPKPVALPELIEPMLIEWMKPAQPRAIRETAVRQLAELLADPRPGVALAAEELLLSMHHDDSRLVAHNAKDALEKHRSNRPAPGTSTVFNSSAPVPLHAKRIVAKSSAVDAEPLPSSLSGLKVPSAASPQLDSDARTRPARFAWVALAIATILAASIPFVSMEMPRLDENVPAVVAEAPIPISTLWVPRGPVPAMPPTSSVLTLTVNRDDSLRNAIVSLVAGRKREKLVTFPARLKLQAHRQYVVEVQDVDRNLRKTFLVPAKQTSHTLWLSADGREWSSAPLQPRPPTGPQPIVRVSAEGGWGNAVLKRMEQELRRDLSTCSTAGSGPAGASFRIAVSTGGRVASAVAQNPYGLPETVIACFARVIKGKQYPAPSGPQALAAIDVLLR